MRANPKKYMLINPMQFSELKTVTEKNAYAFYISLMLKFNNNKIKNPTLHRIAQLTGTGLNQAAKYIKICQKWGLIEKNKNSLYVLQHKDGKLYKLELYRTLKVKEVKRILNLKILKIHIKRQKYVSGLKKLSQNNQNKKTYKLIKNNAKYLHGDYNENVCFSYRYAAKKLNCSIKTVQNIFTASQHTTKIKSVWRFVKKTNSIKDFRTFFCNFNKFSDSYVQFRLINNCIYQLVGSQMF